MAVGTGMNESLNYAEEYSRDLANQFPYVLYFGALYATPNNGRYTPIDAKTIKIPTLRTTGRKSANRDTITDAKRNYDNDWEVKTLTNERYWKTLVHPKDVDQTNYATTIQNITQTFNQFQKFPEMDAYTVSKIYADWVQVESELTGEDHVADDTVITVENALAVFDQMMLNMDNARVPASGRILYVTNEIKYILKEAEKISRYISVEGNSPSVINRNISRLDEVEIVSVPATLMRTLYDFSEGWEPDENAKQINMMLIHPLVVITPVSYEFAQLDPPAAGSDGKYIYYEESHEDVFILNKQSDGIQFNVTDIESSSSSSTN